MFLNNLIRERKKQGSSLTELAVGLLIALPIFLFSFDCVMMMISIQFNDKTCLEAARSAAGGDPNTAELRAQSMLTKANEEKLNMIPTVRLISVTNALNNSDLASIKQYGGTIRGTVTVITAVDLKPLFAGWLMAKKKLTFQRIENFPYTYLIPAPKPVLPAEIN